MTIDYLRHHEIDRKAYNKCVEESLQGTVYAMSWYLDTVSPGWEVLVSGDYEYVMPLPVKKKYGMSYAIQPPMCQQLGVFSSKPVTKEIFDLFVSKIPYANYDLRFNSGNLFENHKGNVGQNHLLDLNKPYQEIRSKYKKDRLRNLQKARNQDLFFSNITDQQEYIDFLTVYASQRSVRALIPLSQALLESSHKNAKAEVWNVRDASQKMLSCAFFIYWKNRVYYMTSVTAPDGKNKQSMSFLLDALIQSRSSTNAVLDFEGSSIPGIAQFFEGFGAEAEIYPHVVKKRLPAKIYGSIKRLCSGNSMD